MSTITPSSFAALTPVHHIILDELVVSDPLSVLTLSRLCYKRVIPVLYRTIHSSPEVFRGLELEQGYERTRDALASTKALSIGGSTSIDTLFELGGREYTRVCHSCAKNPSACCSSSGYISTIYPRRYFHLFRFLERVEIGFSALQASRTYYLKRDRPDLEIDLVGRIGFQTPADLKGTIFHLDEYGVDYWHQVDTHLLYLNSREAVILLKGEVPNSEELVVSSDGTRVGRASFGRIGEQLHTAWPNGERLRVFVGARQPWETLNDYELHEYTITMALALVGYAENLTSRIESRRGWELENDHCKDEDSEDDEEDNDGSGDKKDSGGDDDGKSDGNSEGGDESERSADESEGFDHYEIEESDEDDEGSEDDESDEDDAHEESKPLDRVEIHFPLFDQVFIHMPEEGRQVVDALVRDGRMVLEEFDVKAVKELGERRWSW
ncbi:hypothetical protein L198_02491 [Cryptococcus wingfieldii CBS 7118]|uniref:Uncharacterized protein n=1 Tax=Cryptococcus wingfieldii CBS 7118 TaxID=1295528 RepID=A0A1E3JRZ5_9TREE|nr:hypothetical protein L198_02491 [Cryptococcus wingfieldii CBS 7118]ODO03640.1 hypothetical protein L198_02491 [Cryptococcus wingfieldii CBS 7118]